MLERVKDFIFLRMEQAQINKFRVIVSNMFILIRMVILCYDIIF